MKTYIYISRLFFHETFGVLVTDADLHGDVDGPELSGDDRSIASDIHDATEAHFDNDSMDSDKEALNLVNYLIL